jgi:16S rRNA (guanine(966)-N(2))-methyltransferase RsmD
MRIITGKLKGRSIPIPKTGRLRPTSDRTKEGLFSVIAARTFFEHTRVLDLFAGSGNLGFEALSRGAESCLFVDSHPDHCRQIEKTAQTLDIEEQIDVQVSDVDIFLEKPLGSFHFIFADPPYDYYDMEGLIEMVMERGWMKDTGWFVLEHDKRHDFSDHPLCVFSKPYGRTIVTIFKHDSDHF